MSFKELVTLGFDKNVGPADRVFRLLSGAALTALGWALGAPQWASITMSVLGVMWLATGVLSKCSIYYMLGYSTCPVRSEPAPKREP